MKRNDLIEILKGAYYHAEDHGFSFHQKIDYLLQVCEEKGMLPPPYSIPSESNPTYYFFINRWELED